MPTYRCFFLNEGDHIKAVEIIDAEAVSEAINIALTMLQARPQHHAVEVWEGARRLYPARYGNVLPKDNQR